MDAVMNGDDSSHQAGSDHEQGRAR